MPARPPLVLRVLALACLVVPQTVLLLVQGAAPVLLRDAPLLLLVLHPIEPWSLLVAPAIEPVVFVLVVLAVRLPLYCGDFLVGRWYGEAGLDRLSRSRAGLFATTVQRLFGRAAGPLLVLFPGATVSVLAGATGLSWRRFFPLILSGVLLAAVLTRALAAVASGPLVALTEVIGTYALPLGVALVVVAVGSEVVRARRARAAESPPPPEQVRD